MLYVLLSYTIFIHTCVHCRYDEFLTGCCKHSCCQHVVCNAVSTLRDNICAGRSDGDDISLLGQRDVLYGEFEVAVKCVSEALIAGECFECDGVYEVDGVLCHNNVNVSAFLFEHTCKVCGLVSGDTSGNAKYNRFILEHLAPPMRYCPYIFPVRCITKCFPSGYGTIQIFVKHVCILYYYDSYEKNLYQSHLFLLSNCLCTFLHFEISFFLA